MLEKLCFSVKSGFGICYNLYNCFEKKEAAGRPVCGKHMSSKKEQREWEEITRKVTERFEQENERRRKIIAGFDDDISRANDLPVSEEASMAVEIMHNMREYQQFLFYIACRYREFELRSKRGEEGADVVLFAVHDIGEDSFWETAADYRVRTKSYEGAFPGFENDRKLRQAYMDIDPREAQFIPEKEEQFKKEAEEEKRLTEEIERNKKKNQKAKKAVARHLLFQDIGIQLLGIFLSVLFGVAAYAHWALHHGWEGPKNVFLEVVFPFLVVIATIFFAAQACALLIGWANSDLAFLGYIAGGAAAIAFLVFWKHKAVCLGVQIVISGLILAFLIMIFASIIRFFQKRKN